MTAIKFSARKVNDPTTATTECAVVYIFSDSKLSGTASALNKASGGAIKAVLDLGDFTGKSGQCSTLPGTGKIKRLLLVGCGEKKQFDRSAARDFAQAVYSGINGTSAKSAL